MLYSLIKIPAKFALWIYARNLSVNKRKFLQSKGPLLIACNHPNSFLDAIVIDTIFKQPVYSLARGDAFGNKLYARVLKSLHMLPVYRVSEGVENLEHNYKTFDACKEIFRRNGIVLIFSEGRCINEWHLRSLKKGTARLAISSWQDGIPLKVIPTGINYNSFTSFGKNIQLNFGELISAENIKWEEADGKNIVAFNDQLRTQLNELVIEADGHDKKTLKKIFFIKPSSIKKIILLIPALIGYVLHAPLYLLAKKIFTTNVKEEGHFDSVMMGLLFILYPIYLLLFAIAFLLIAGSWWWASIFILFPFCAYSWVQLKQQF